MIALDATLRRLTVCQLTGESRGNGGGLRPRVWLRLRAAAGGNWTPDGILQLEGDANFSLSWAHEAHPKPTLHGVVFQKLNGPLPREAATHKRQRRGGHNAAASANEGDTTKQACTGGEGRAAASRTPSAVGPTERRIAHGAQHTPTAPCTHQQGQSARDRPLSA